jgi:hypothetical protein
MEPINRESRTSVHFQLGCDRLPVDDRVGPTVELQKAMLTKGWNSGRPTPGRDRYPDAGEPSHLQVKFETPGPHLTGIQVLANNPRTMWTCSAATGRRCCRPTARYFPSIIS